MTVTIELPPEKKAALRAQAQALGLSLEQCLLRLDEQSTLASSPTEGRRTGGRFGRSSPTT